MFPGLQPAARNSSSPAGLENKGSETSSKELMKCFRRSKVKETKGVETTEGERGALAQLVLLSHWSLSHLRELVFRARKQE